ncbi:MAG: hypothetical protein M1457_12090 [bacterium]|nr:hypothetical protein [bacterium]
MTNEPFATFRELRRLARPSNVARAVWLLVAALHVWLVARRIVSGDVSSLLDLSRTLLCLAAVGYASLKFWHVATILDSSPRRALAFGLILFVGHWLINPQLLDPTAPDAAAAVNITMVAAILPAIGAALMVLAIALRGSAPTALGAGLRRLLPRFTTCETAHLPLIVARRATRLYRRPPPYLV